MIIYNSNKEFVGIDASDLKALGFKNLATLQAESSDFANLFVKTPGHVHNFKHVHWIDFVLCAKSAQESKAIIHANDKNFKTNLEVKTIYLSDSPSTPAYSVHLNNLSHLSLDETTDIAGELQSRVAPIAAVRVTESDQASPIEKITPTQTPEIKNDDPIDIIDDPYATLEEDVIDIYEPSEEDLANIGEAEIEEEPYEESIELPEDEDYTFDPLKTAEALEMPLSLIEEFIEDFISQAKEFKGALYDAVAQDDMIELQAYSHKLKGVAANLRVQDALEILTTINKSKDFTTSKKELDTFYRIISKLSGEKVLKKTKASVVKNSTIREEIEPSHIDVSDIAIDDDDELLEIIEDDDDMELVISDDFDMLDDPINETIDQNDMEEVEKVTIKEYNKKSAALEIGLDTESFNELFNDYIKESQILVESIEEAINNNISEIWRESAIKLKGMSDNMRIDNFKTNLEILIKTKNTDDAKDALTKIQTTIFELLEKKD